MAPAPEATLTLHCHGVVQGVGFRPCVHRLATALDLCGVVDNHSGAVVVQLSGCRSALERFLEILPRELPAPARLESLQPHWGPPPAPGCDPRGIRLGHQPPHWLKESLFAPALAADQAPCRACLAELNEPANRRHGYPFISCSACGPRYSIATAEPYARAHTTLAGFPLCQACQREFDDPSDRRFHAETTGCPTCGPRLAFWPADGSQPTEDSGRGCQGTSGAIAAAVAVLRRGGILALQGVGGFQLLVDATDPAALQRLRQRKQRPHKPFALLVDSASWIEPLVQLTPAERAVLESAAAPIVLLRRHGGRRAHASGRQEPALPEAVAPGSPCLGVMLPASPLHHLLAAAFGKPLVATSGNRSGEPLCIAPPEAVDRLAGIADAFLVHNRPIVRPLDDSVLQLIEGRPVLLRRGRGYAPEALPITATPPMAIGEVRLALGGDLKCAPALARDGQVWLAPHLGDLDNPRQSRRLRQAAAEMVSVRPASKGPPLTLLCDSHPDYRSHQIAADLVATASPDQGLAESVRLCPVPHHLAHGLAVVAEHGLAACLEQAPLLLLVCDGLGLGVGSGSEPASGSAPAAPLWGCELLLLEAGGPAIDPAAKPGLHPAGKPARNPAEPLLRWRRLASLRPFPLPGGDRASAEPRRAALGLLAAAGPAALAHSGGAACRAAFTAADWHLLVQAIAGGCNSPRCSSLGRLFDAVASLLDLCQVLSYEGQGGLQLQGRASELREEDPGAVQPAYPLPLRPAPQAAGLPLGWLDWQPLLEALLKELPLQACPGAGAVQAARFHRAVIAGLVAMAEAAAPGWGCQRVVLAGGCFQNRLLLEGCRTGLRAAGLEPFSPESVPCNDGGLALGQLWALSSAMATTESKPTHRVQHAHVPGPAWSHPLDHPPAACGGAGGAP
ncbi:carbamoyltransferase HypF [Synechococcus sp. CBW1002]|uniref:carbamoyltransferase HypF n=1 Tax=Synechococcus sp. CBW1002 TaxID=1353134 RepID=UPI0018CCEAE0|nr:carbamoyltransferase HypF [Synechococcus sp. CBW1002]QPN58701.1 carbamoyltransferase HypF [Synechococcus sp. CBW1002]